MLEYFAFAALCLVIAGYITRALNNKMTNAKPQSDDRQKPETKKPFAVPDPSTLLPSRSDPISVADLKKYDGSDSSLPIYVAIKGTVFDVSAKREMYGSGGSYNIFAGKDASVALGKSSLKAEDATADYSILDAEERQVLDDWESFFSKRYNVVGKIVE